jgi:hypothetical protein
LPLLLVTETTADPPSSDAPQLLVKGARDFSIGSPSMLVKALCAFKLLSISSAKEKKRGALESMHCFFARKRETTFINHVGHMVAGMWTSHTSIPRKFEKLLGFNEQLLTPFLSFCFLILFFVV